MPWPQDEYTSDWLVEPKKLQTEHEHLVRAENPIMEEGQLGSDLLDKGPEGSNPEGSVDINDRQYIDRTHPHR